MNRLARASVVQHFLRQWYEIDNNIGHLTAVQTVQAKILYSLLKELDKGEVEKLAAKYRVERKPYELDSTVAKMFDTTIEKYGYERRKIEFKLRRSFFKIHGQYKEELSKAVGLEYAR